MATTRREAVGALGSAGAAAVAGCLGSLGGSDGGGVERASVSLVLNWKPNGLHVPYFAAADQGFYADEGFEDVTIESGQGADVSAQQVGLGNETFAITSGGQLLNVNSRDLSPRCVGVAMQRGQVVVFTAREQFGEELTDVSQLEGATVGSSPGSVRLMTRNYFAQHGILDTLEYVDTGFDTIQQLLPGEVEAACGVFSEIADARREGYTIDSLAVADTIRSYGHVVATGDSFAADNPETVRSFLRGTARGFAWAAQNPSDAVDALVDSQPELEEVRANQREKWDLMVDDYVLSETVRERGWGWSEAEPWREAYETLLDGGMLESEIDPEAVWTNEYLNTDHEYVGEFAEVVE